MRNENEWAYCLALLDWIGFIDRSIVLGWLSWYLSSSSFWEGVGLGFSVGELGWWMDWGWMEWGVWGGV